MLLVQGFEPPK